jgi:hypothetical protein
MRLSEIKNHLANLTELTFLLPDGSAVPAHFHVTEIGQINKRFIDCGGTLRNEDVINFQLWEDGDYDHRIGASKLLHIISLSERLLELEDREIEVEYQGQTIGKYGLDFNGKSFVLTNTQTDCLAKNKCGIPASKPKVRIGSASSCVPNTGCC